MKAIQQFRTVAIILLTALLFGLAVQVSFAQPLSTGQTTATVIVQPAAPQPPALDPYYGLTPVAFVAHTRYGPGWLEQSAEGYALVIPTNHGSWAILYDEGALLTGVPDRAPAWVSQLGAGPPGAGIDPGPVIDRGVAVP